MAGLLAVPTERVVAQILLFRAHQPHLCGSLWGSHPMDANIATALTYASPPEKTRTRIMLCWRYSVLQVIGVTVCIHSTTLHDLQKRKRGIAANVTTVNESFGAGSDPQ